MAICTAILQLEKGYFMYQAHLFKPDGLLSFWGNVLRWSLPSLFVTMAALSKRSPC